MKIAHRQERSGMHLDELTSPIFQTTIKRYVHLENIHKTTICFTRVVIFFKPPLLISLINKAQRAETIFSTVISSIIHVQITIVRWRFVYCHNHQKKLSYQNYYCTRWCTQCCSIARVHLPAVDVICCLLPIRHIPAMPFLNSTPRGVSSKARDFNRPRLLYQPLGGILAKSRSKWSPDLAVAHQTHNSSGTTWPASIRGNTAAEHAVAIRRIANTRKADGGCAL